MSLSSEINNAMGTYPYKYKQIPMRRLERWKAKATQLERLVKIVKERRDEGPYDSGWVAANEALMALDDE